MGASIRNDFVKKSKTEEDFVEKEGGDSLGGDGFLGRAKNHPLSKPMVDHDQERVKAQGERVIGDEVTGDLLEGARGNRFDGQQGGYSGVCVNLILLAKGTALHVSADEGGESRPPKFGSDQLACLQETGVAGRCVVMAAFENGAAEGIVCRDVDMAFVGKDSHIDLPVGESGTERKGNIFMHGLCYDSSFLLSHRSSNASPLFWTNFEPSLWDALRLNSASIVSCHAWLVSALSLYGRHLLHVQRVVQPTSFLSHEPLTFISALAFPLQTLLGLCAGSPRI